LFYFSRKGDPAIASLRFRLILRLEYADVIGPIGPMGVQS
jgi:hypothetical protein